uniref:TerB family tellurite resistance protein n=1 Tax=Halobacteriovorax sp. TaxID=2020862 RepID=UPI00356A2D78
MSFWDRFIAKEVSKPLSKLQESILVQFPDYTEEKRVLLGCLAALSARVAYVDFEISPKEKDAMIEALKKWMNLTDKEAEFVSTKALE